MSTKHNQKLTEKSARISLDLIRSEIRFYHHIFTGLPEQIQPHAALCFFSVFSSFLVESANTLAQPAVHQKLAGDDLISRAIELLNPRQEIIQRARQRMKFLDDRLKDYDQVTASLREAIEADRLFFESLHQGRFFRIQRFIQPDLGVSLLNRRVLSTTHSQFFGLGMNNLHDESATREGSGQDHLLLEISRDYGEFIGMVHQAIHLDLGRTTGATEANYPKVEFVDIKSRKHYADVAKRVAPGFAETAPFLYFILSQLRTVAWLLPPVLRITEPLFGFRSTVILTFQSVFSLSVMYKELLFRGSLAPDMIPTIGSVLAEPSVKEVLELKPLRNALMHLSVNRWALSRTDDRHLNQSLARAHGFDWDIEALQDHLIGVADSVGDHIESWLDPPIRIVHRF